MLPSNVASAMVTVRVSFFSSVLMTAILRGLILISSMIIVSPIIAIGLLVSPLVPTVLRASIDASSPTIVPVIITSFCSTLATATLMIYVSLVVVITPGGAWELLCPMAIMLAVSAIFLLAFAFASSAIISSAGVAAAATVAIG